MNNRLQFRHHSPIFDTREEAIEYIYSQVRFAEEGLAFDDKSYGFSLFAEPLIIRYKNENDSELPSGSTPNPHVILAIGSNTNEGTQYNDNRFCIIDIDKTEAEIEDIWEELEKAISGLTIFTRDTNTLKLYAEKNDSGTVISGDVVLAPSQIFDDARKPNVIMNTDDGLFLYVNMDYDKDNDKISFTLNGDSREWYINNNYLVRGYYNKRDESLHLIRKDDVDITISLENLIDEWGVEGEASNTPIVLTREEVGYGDDSSHNHVEPWQDLLKADIRLADRRYNILKKTSDGRYLYVDGLASNITFFKDGEEMNVQEALINATKGVSNDSTNIIYEKADGYFATAMLKYLNKDNKLIFTTSNVTGGTTVEEIQLNAVKAFEKIYYDSVTENLIILYLDGSGAIQEVDVPIGEMMQDWEWDIVNDGHNVKLHKQRVIAGNDKVSADAALYDDPDNILVDKNHELFVKGTADNIRYGRESNVEFELDTLIDKSALMDLKINTISGDVDTLRSDVDGEIARARNAERLISEKLDQEIARSTAKDNEHDTKISTIEQTIGDGFSIDGHETVTYKFNELSAKTNTISAKTDTVDANLSLLSAKTEAEIVRAKGEEHRIEQKFDDELGEGFNIRDTVRDEFNREKAERIEGDAVLQSEIDELSATTGGKLIDIFNYDHSIGIDKTDDKRPIIKVNLSTEVEDGKPNIIKLNADGLYAGVDLDYEFGDGKNQLIFKTTNETKKFDLMTNSVVDRIYYDPTREAIIVEYTVNGHRMPDVVIPVGDLINEWRVSESTNGAIKLTKTRDASTAQDVLYAENIISNHEDNILINDGGALYVSGSQIEQNKADIAALEGRMDTAENDIDSLENALANEVSRATAEEARINQKLDAEISRSTEEDNAIRTDLNSEITRSTERDAQLSAEIAAEVQRAQNVERILQEEIDAEGTSRASGYTELDTKINNEIIRATNQEQLIDSKLDREINRSTNEDNDLWDALRAEITRSTNKDNELSTSISNETQRARDAENAIHNEIITESTARVSGDTELTAKINTETNRATSEEQRIEGKLDREIERSTAKDSEFETRLTTVANNLDAEITRSTTEDNRLAFALSSETLTRISEDSALDTKITNEASRASNEEQRIEGKLDNEISRSTAKDSEIDTNINGLRSDLTNEVNDRMTGDNDLRDLIRQEEDRAKTVESGFTHALEVETIARQNGDSTLDAKIDTEVTNRENADTQLQTSITNEASTRLSEDTRIEGKLDNEISRSTNKDNDLQQQITTEATTARSAESALREGLTTEISNRTVVDSNLQAQITNEVERAKGSESALTIMIANEKEARENEDAHIWSKIRPIEFYDTTTIHNTRVRNSGENPDEVRNSLIISQSADNIILANDTLGGVYATAKLGYNQSANALTIYGPNDKILNTVTLGPGSLIKDISYDSAEKDLVITYRRAGDEEDTVMKFPVADLFNEWDVRNPSEGSALELTKDSQTTETGTVDILSGRVLVTSAVVRPGGEVDYGDNIIRIVNNGLYASGSAITEAQETAECVKNELKVVELAVLGSEIGSSFICGEGYTYSPYEEACFISAATSMYDADKILDKYVCSAHTRITNLEEDVQCLQNELDVTQTNVLGITIPPCGLNVDGTPYRYVPHIGSCIISAATSMDEADVMLDNAICSISGDSGCLGFEIKKLEQALGVTGHCNDNISYPITQGCLLSTATTFAEADSILEEAICSMKFNILSSDTPTASVSIVDQGSDKQVKASVRLSHGNEVGKWQTDSDLVITDYSGDCTESGESGCAYAEFTDTNVLRIVDLTDSIGMAPDSNFNGLYLSNVWNCGQYTENGDGTPYGKYKIDDSPTAMNYYNRKYKNGSRYRNS